MCYLGVKDKQVKYAQTIFQHVQIEQSVKRKILVSTSHLRGLDYISQDGRGW